MLFRVDFELPYPARSQHRHLRQCGAAWLINPRAAGRNTSQAFHLHSTPELFSRAAEAKVRARAGCQGHRHRGECDLRPRNAHSPAIPVQFGRVWIVPRSLVIAAWRFDLLQNFNDAGAAFDGIIEMKNEMRRVFHSDMTGQLSLQSCTMRREFAYDTLTEIRSKNADKYMRILQIRADIDM